MDAESFAAGVTAGAALLGLAALAWYAVTSKSRKDASVAVVRSQADMQTKATSLSLALYAIAAQMSAKPRYQVTLDDWGPDFTGEDGTLPRWRWMVTDADRAVRKILTEYRTQGLDGGQMPEFLMLGNEPTSADAWVEAHVWVEQQGYPATVVTVP